MGVVFSATESEFTFLFLGLLKQHNRLTTNKSARKSQLINALDSTDKGTQFSIILGLSVDLREVVFGHPDVRQPEHWNCALEFYSKNEGVFVCTNILFC